MKIVTYAILAFIGFTMWIGLYIIVILFPQNYIKHIVMGIGYLGVAIFCFGYIKLIGAIRKRKIERQNDNDIERN